MEAPVIAAFITAIVALVVGVISFLANMQSTKVQRQKAYLDFLRHKMDQLEEVMKLFQEPVSADNLGDAYYQIASAKLRKMRVYLSAYSHLFTNTREKFEKLVNESDQLALQFGRHKIILNDRLSNKPLPEGLPDLQSVIEDTFKTAAKCQTLISEELAATYKVFEKLSK